MAIRFTYGGGAVMTRVTASRNTAMIKLPVRSKGQKTVGRVAIITFSIGGDMKG